MLRRPMLAPGAGGRESIWRKVRSSVLVLRTPPGPADLGEVLIRTEYDMQVQKFEVKLDGLLCVRCWPTGQPRPFRCLNVLPATA